MNMLFDLKTLMSHQALYFEMYCLLHFLRLLCYLLLRNNNVKLIEKYKNFFRRYGHGIKIISANNHVQWLCSHPQQLLAHNLA